MNVFQIKRLIASFFYRLGLIKLASWIRIWIFKRPRIVVLCYHRVIEQGGVISPQCVSPKLFEAHVRYLTQHNLVMTLQDVNAYRCQNKTLTQDAVVFTFDDGYEDNYTHAAPILEKYCATGCFFVSSAPILEHQPYWIDQLSVLLDAWSKENSPPLSCLKHKLDEQTQKMMEAFLIQAQSDLKAAAKTVFGYANNLRVEQRDDLIQTLALPIKSRPKTPDLMSVDQLKELVKRGHVIGAHTVTHPKLSLLKKEAVQKEVVDGIQALRRHVACIDFFAYPFGKQEDLPHQLDWVFDVLNKQKILLSVTTEDAAVDFNDSPHLVHRKVISAQPLAQISLKLEMLKWQIKKKNP